MIKRPASRATAAGLSLLAAVAIPVAAASAASYTFPLDGAEGLSTFTETIGGITLTLNNAVGLLNTFHALGGGVTLGTGANYFTSSGFNFSLDTTVEVVGYNVASESTTFSPGADFSLSTGPVLVSSTNPLVPAGDYLVSGTFIAVAGVTNTLSAGNYEANDFSRLHSLTVTTLATAVPEPGTWTLLGIGGLLLTTYRSRRAVPAAE